MSYSTLPVSYCGNVHPALSLEALLPTLSETTAAVQQRLGQPIAAGLWLPDGLATHLETDPNALNRLQQTLQAQGLICYTLNAFPFGNFHSDRVKEQVYLPDWTTPARLDYTARCARLLAELLPEGVEGSISTVPLGFRELATDSDFTPRCIDQLLELAIMLDEIHDATGRVIRLAIEPEPLCVLETTPQTVQFFEQLRSRATERNLLEVAEYHLGVCYDICHQSVEFEEVAESIATLQQAGIRINKVHITCAIELRNPAENEAGREFLAQFAEPRYLHQTSCQSNGITLWQTDLTADFARNPPAEWLAAESWRIHFHVPVHTDELGPLHSTRPDLLRGLAAVQALEYAPHLEVETYTWSVLPGAEPPELIEGLTRELRSTLEVLALPPAS